MKTNILIILVIMSGVPAVAVTAAADQTNKRYPERQTTQDINRNPTAENSTVSESGATWGLHEPLNNCLMCHSASSEQNPTDKVNLVASVPALCYACHERYDTPGGWVHGPVAAGECLVCHTPHKTDYASLLKKPIPQLCYNCHEPKALQLVENHSDESYTHCNVCHAGHISQSRMLLRNHFLNTDEGLIYISKDPSSLSRPQFVDRRSSLVGLQGVEVIPVIDGLEIFRRYGVSDDLLKMEVEQQLQQDGIKLFNHAEQTTKQPSLQVHLRLMEVPSSRQPGQVVALSGSFNIFLQQTVELLPTPEQAKRRYCTATTWDTAAILVWSTSQIEEGLREAVQVLVSRFVKDYRTANPKTRISVSVTDE